MKSKIIEILMKRDGLTKEDAIAYYKDMRCEVAELIQFGDYDGVEDYLMSEGFEMDYIFDFI